MLIRLVILVGLCGPANMAIAMPATQQLLYNHFHHFRIGYRSYRTSKANLGSSTSEKSGDA